MRDDSRINSVGDIVVNGTDDDRLGHVPVVGRKRQRGRRGRQPSVHVERYDHVGGRLDLDYAYGVRHQVDDDARTIGDELLTDEPGSHDIDTVLSHLTELECVEREDITIITDEGSAETPGIRLDFNLEILLNCFNQHVMSTENMIGLLGSFGVPDLR